MVTEVIKAIGIRSRRSCEVRKESIGSSRVDVADDGERMSDSSRGRMKSQMSKILALN